MNPKVITSIAVFKTIMRRFHCTDINVKENDIVLGEYYITATLPDFGQITAVVKVRGGKEWVTAPDYLVKQTKIKKNK